MRHHRRGKFVVRQTATLVPEITHSRCSARFFQSRWLVSLSLVRRQLVQFVALTASFFASAAPVFGGALDSSSDAREATAIARQHQPLRTHATYKIAGMLDGDVYPAFANFASMQKPQQRQFGVVAVTVSNSTDLPLRNRVSVKVQGWSDEEIQFVEMAAGQVQTYIFAPTFLPRLYQNHEIAGATAHVEVSDGAGRTVYETTIPVRLRSADDMYWGTKFKYAPFIASWVTPHDSNVEVILSRAKEFMPGRRLPGYEPWKAPVEQERSTIEQARAIYRALQKAGVSYVKSSTTFGANPNVSQRVRMPRESLSQSSANCIDGAVMYASLFENLGMDPVVVLVPGHAYVGVRVARGSQRYLFVDTALTGRVNFDAAVFAADKGLAKFGPSQITRIPIDSARESGIYPMP
jgi:hypothetical protein